jgi:sulfite reductase beta subunit-like hemoprotein
MSPHTPANPIAWAAYPGYPHRLGPAGGGGLTSLQTGMDNSRNVVGCPVAGLTTTGLFHASSVARRFTAMSVGDKAFTNLPQKFYVTITGCRENCVHAETQDLALVPKWPFDWNTLATAIHQGVHRSGLSPRPISATYRQ